jgi:hypothetical protein
MPAARAESPPRPLTRAESRDPRQPVYSPDGRLLLLASNRSGNLELWTANSDGSWAHQLPTNGSHQFQNGRWNIRRRTPKTRSELLAGAIVGRPSHLREGDLGRTEHIRPEDTADRDYGKLLERAALKQGVLGVATLEGLAYKSPLSLSREVRVP